MSPVPHETLVAPPAPRAAAQAEQRSWASAVGGTMGRASVALVHDYLNQPGGAERVVLALSALWPDAPIYTSLYRVDSTFPGFGAAEVRTSALNRLPVDRGFRNLFPLYPAAFSSFGRLEQDIVISSSSGWAHTVRTAPHTFHVVYCHAPARWLYASEHLTGLRPRALRPFKVAMRTWDRSAARRVDLYVANSEEIRQRILRTYGVQAPVVHPPVNIDRFRPTERGERLLVVSRLLPYKRVDVIVDTATQAGIGLDVIGTGPSLDDLRRRAGPTVAFHGRVPDDVVSQFMQSCRALCLPGTEDFGITPVEAIAAGKPVVAFAAGGALETVIEGVSGAFFSERTSEAVLDAIGRADRIDLSPQRIADNARRFSTRAFERRFLDVLVEHLGAHRSRAAAARP